MDLSNNDVDWRRNIMGNGVLESKFRPPPAGLSASEFRLCVQYQKIRTCRLGNQCVEAHGIEELNEWTIQWNLRKDQISKNIEENVLAQSFLQKLQLDCTQTEDLESIFAPNLPFVDIQVQEKAHVTLTTKPATTKWKIWVKSSKVLQNVALLEDNHRENFKIQNVLMQTDSKQGQMTKNCQEWHNSSCENLGILAITIKFQANVYGSFGQSVILGRSQSQGKSSC